MDDQFNIGNLTPLDVEDELKKSFISYAMAVIVSRALPDVRDGLKPVPQVGAHRGRRAR